MSSEELHFELTSKSILPLSQLFQQNDSRILFRSHEIAINRELSLFLSFHLFNHFSISNEPYSIDFPDQLDLIDDISDKEIIKAISCLISLIKCCSSIDVTKKEIINMALIAGKINNYGLRGYLFQSLQADKSTITIKSSTLGSAINLPSEQFCFSACGKTFKCNCVLAAYLSRKVLKNMLIDRCYNHLDFFVPNGCSEIDFWHIFHEVFSIISGFPLTITAENSAAILSVALQIENEELISSILGKFLDSNANNFNQSIDFLSKFKYFYDFPPLKSAIDTAASNFSERMNEMKMISVPILQKILSSNQLKALNEDQICEFVIEKIQECGSDALSLISQIQFKFLSSNKMKALFNLLGMGIFAYDYSDSLKGRLICDIQFEATEDECRRWVLNPNDHSEENRKISDFLTRNSAFFMEISGKRVVGSQKNFCGILMIPEGIEEIGENAFSKSEMTSVIFPSSLKKIEKCAFNKCASLTGELTLPYNLESIGEYAFNGCRKLFSVRISNTTKIEKSSFALCMAKIIIEQPK